MIGESNFKRKEFSEALFWDQRFSEHETTIDWYCTYKELEDIVEDYSDSDSRVLMVGCGNSTLSNDIVLGRPGICVDNIDISEVVINKMANNTPEDISDRLSWRVMDATAMEFNSEMFDLIIDKGTLDALATAETSEMTQKLILESCRVLKTGGHLILISHSHFIYRKKFFDQTEASLELVECLKVPLNDMSCFTNIARSKLQSQPLKTLFMPENTDLLTSVMTEFQKSKRDRALSLMLRRFKRKRAKKSASQKGIPLIFLQPPDSGDEQPSLDANGQSILPRRDHSYVMVFRKRYDGEESTYMKAMEVVLQQQEEEKLKELERID